MKKLSALALAAALGLTAMAPIASVEAATAKKPAPQMTAKKPAMSCHTVKGKDGKMHKLCHHAHAKKPAAKKAAKKK